MGHAIDPRSRSGDAAPAALDGISILAVRKDTTGAIDPNGDVTPLQVDSDGALKVTGTASANSQYVVDTASTGTESGTVILAVRNDAGGSLVSANNDLSSMQVDANGALRVLPATHAVTQSGTWNVGSVTTLPALPTGTNAIGTVGVTSLPALPAGTNAIGTVDVGNTVTVTLGSALPAGSAVIGAVTQSGTWNVGSITTLPALAAGTADIGAVKQTHKPTPYKLISAATTNATSVSATANTLLYGYYISNTNAAVRYVKFYNKASAPTVGTDVPVLVLAIPASGAANVSFPAGINFTTGLAFATTTGAADTDTAAVALNEVIVNLAYATY